MVAEHTGEPTGHTQTFENIDDFLTHNKQNINTRVLPFSKRGRKPTNDITANKITGFLANMPKPTDDPLSFPEYLNMAHELNEIKKDKDIETDKHVNLSDINSMVPGLGKCCQKGNKYCICR